MNLLKRIKRRLNIIYSKMRGMELAENAFVHHSVDVTNAKNVKIGKGSYIYKQTSIYVSSGSFEIGKSSHIAPFGYLLIDKNNLIIGDNVAIGPFCSMICHSNNTKGASKIFTENYLDADITIGNNVFIGTQCNILPGVIIENDVVVASNSVVKGKLESGYVYGGTPAKKIKKI